MRMYVVILATGVPVGIIYGPLDVRSPAPLVVALVGLLSILMGEQVIPLARQLLAGNPICVSWPKTNCMPHLFGKLPTKSTAVVTDREVRT